MKFQVTSKLFGLINVESSIVDDPDDMWLDINPYLCVNIWIHPLDEDKEDLPLEDTRYLSSIWACKMREDGLNTFSEEIEDYTECRVQIVK